MVIYKQFRFFGNWKEFEEWYSKQTITRKITSVQHHHTWKPDYSYFKGDMNPKITKGENHFKLMENLDNYHELTLGWRDSGEHVMTFPDGVIATARDFNIQPAGIYGQNKGAICIENLGNFDKGHDVITDLQKESIIGITSVFMKRHELIPNINTIVYHHWFDQDSGKRTNGEYGNVKNCPSHNFFGGNKVEDCENNFIPLVKKYMDGDIVKDYKEILKEKTDSPDKWIEIIDNFKNGIVDVKDIKTLRWFKDLIEKVSGTSYKTVLKNKTHEYKKWIEITSDFTKGMVKLENMEVLFWMLELIEKLGNI